MPTNILQYSIFESIFQKTYLVILYTEGTYIGTFIFYAALLLFIEKVVFYFYFYGKPYFNLFRANRHNY